MFQGKFCFNKATGAWYVRGSYQGEQHFFSKYYSDLGPRICKTKDEAIQLQTIISSELANGHFNPLRYKKTKPLHLKKYATEWLGEVNLTLKFATYKTYRAAINNLIIPILGNVFLPDIRYDHYLKLWVEIKKSEKYRKNIITCLYTIMEDCRRAGYINQLPEKIKFQGKLPSQEGPQLDTERNTAENTGKDQTGRQAYIPIPVYHRRQAL